MQDLQLFIEVDGNSTEQAEYLKSIATEQRLEADFEVDRRLDIITLWAYQPQERAANAEEPDPVAFGQVVRNIVDSGTFGGLKAKFYTTDTHMFTRCRNIIGEFGIGGWATVARVEKLPKANLQAAPAAARGTLSG